MIIAIVLLAMLVIGIATYRIIKRAIRINQLERRLNSYTKDVIASVLIYKQEMV